MTAKNIHKIFIVRKSAKIRNRYDQAPHLTQDTNGKVTTSQLDITNERQEVSPFFLSLYTARASFEYYRQVYFVHSGLQDESPQVSISKLHRGWLSLNKGHPVNVPIRRTMHLSSVIPANDIRKSGSDTEVSSPLAGIEPGTSSTRGKCHNHWATTLPSRWQQGIPKCFF